MERASVRTARGGEIANVLFTISDGQNVSAKVAPRMGHRPATICNEIERGARELALARVPKRAAKHGQLAAALCPSMSRSERTLGVRDHPRNGRKAKFILGPAIGFECRDGITALAAAQVIQSIS